MTNNAPEFYEAPAVHIYVVPPVSEKMLNPILWGLEEEGIPARMEEKGSGGAVVLAKSAASGSMLNVGIGIIQNEVVLHHRDLSPQTPLFVLSSKECSRTNLRRIGANAARLVKGNPLLVPDDLLAPEMCQLP